MPTIHQKLWNVGVAWGLCAMVQGACEGVLTASVAREVCVGTTVGGCFLPAEGLEFRKVQCGQWWGRQRCGPFPAVLLGRPARAPWFLKR